MICGKVNMIDVAISSCARPKILSKSVYSFLDKVKSKEKLRLIICEDKMDDPERIRIGREWIESNKDLFDEIIYSEKRLTYVFCFTEILKYVKSDYFFRLEDDVVFDQDIDIDDIIDFMKTKEKLSQLIFKRSLHNIVNPRKIDSGFNRKIVHQDFCSIATGVYNTKLIRDIVNYSGTGECHESSVLTPSMKKLDLQSGVVFGVNRDEAINYLGDDPNLKKGAYIL